MEIRYARITDMKSPKSLIGRFPWNKVARKQELRANQVGIDYLKEKGITGQEWRFKDSPLLTDTGRNSYETTFQDIIPNKDSLATYLGTSLAYTNKKGGVVVIDIGGPGREVASDIREIETGADEKLTVKKSLGVTLEDIGNNRSDVESNHSVIEADLLEKETDRKIEEWLGEDKLDLIVERMAGGLDFMPNEPYALIRKVEHLYELLADGGVMLIQVPKSLKEIFREWAKEMEKHKETIEFQFKAGDLMSNSSPSLNSAFLLRKLPGAPKKLPVLSVKRVQQIATYEE